MLKSESLLIYILFLFLVPNILNGQEITQQDYNRFIFEQDYNRAQQFASNRGAMVTSFKTIGNRKYHVLLYTIISEKQLETTYDYSNIPIMSFQEFKSYEIKRREEERKRKLEQEEADKKRRLEEERKRKLEQERKERLKEQARIREQELKRERENERLRLEYESKMRTLAYRLKDETCVDYSECEKASYEAGGDFNKAIAIIRKKEIMNHRGDSKFKIKNSSSEKYGRKAYYKRLEKLVKSFNKIYFNNKGTDIGLNEITEFDISSFNMDWNNLGTCFSYWDLRKYSFSNSRSLESFSELLGKASIEPYYIDYSNYEVYIAEMTKANKDYKNWSKLYRNFLNKWHLN